MVLTYPIKYNFHKFVPSSKNILREEYRESALFLTFSPFFRVNQLLWFSPIQSNIILCLSFPRNKLVPQAVVQIFMHKGEKDGGSERTSSPKFDQFPPTKFYIECVLTCLNCSKISQFLHCITTNTSDLMACKPK